MKPTLLLAVIGGLMWCGAGCDSKPAEPVASPAPPAAPAEAPKAPVANAPAYKPEYALAIEQSTTTPKTYAVTYSAKVNSGGWKLTSDSVLVEEYNGMMACRIFATLEQPNPSATVTQEMQTITGKYDAGTVEIGRVEFSVRRQVNGVTYTSPAAYSVVKNIKYPY